MPYDIIYVLTEKTNGRSLGIFKWHDMQPDFHLPDWLLV
jgi:hypothetical protein